MKKELIVEILIALMILLFLYASFSKIVNMAAFRHAMNNQPFPKWFAGIVVWTLPTTEIAIAAALAFIKTRIYGLYAFITLMGSFTLYISAILLHLFPWVPCSCGGVIQALGWPTHFILNLCFIIISIIALNINQQISKPLANKTTKLKNA